MLWMFENLLDDDCMDTLGEYIKCNNNLKIVSFGKNKVSDRGVAILANYLDGNTSLKYLSFIGNVEISNYSISIISKMIESSRIVSLFVDETSITRRNSFAISLAKNQLNYGEDKLDLNGQYVAE